MGVSVSPYPIYASSTPYSFTNSAGVPYRRPGEGYEFTGSAGSVHQSFMLTRFQEYINYYETRNYDTSKAPPRFSASALLTPSGEVDSAITAYCVHDGQIYDCTAGDIYNIEPRTSGPNFDRRNNTSMYSSVNILYAPFATWPTSQLSANYTDLVGYVNVEHPDYSRVGIQRGVRRNSLVNSSDLNYSDSACYFYMFQSSQTGINQRGNRYTLWEGVCNAGSILTSTGFWRSAAYLRAAEVIVTLSANRVNGSSTSGYLVRPTGFAISYASSLSADQTDTATVNMFNSSQYVIQKLSSIMFTGGVWSGKSAGSNGFNRRPITIGIDPDGLNSITLTFTGNATTASASSNYITARASQSNCVFSASISNSAGITNFTPWFSARYANGQWTATYAYTATAR